MALIIGSASLIASCATVAPTTETYTSYRIYSVPNSYTLTEVRDALVNTAKEFNNNAAVINNIPPHPLPETPGRFTIKHMNMGPVSMQFPQMSDATVSVRSNKNPSSSESMNWVAGIYPYKGGYSVQFVMVATYQRGTANIFDPRALGAALGREAAYSQDGGVEGRIKIWFDSFVNKIDKKVTMKLEEAYPQG